MSKYRVCVYAICKNEAQFVDRWMDAVSAADMVVVVDTGSTDQTVEKLRARGAVVFEEQIKPWRFDAARNLAMDHIPEDMDICVSNDLDEVFEDGWRDALERAWKSSYTRARYWFASTHHADGTVDKKFPMEKMHCRTGFRWVHPVHEVLEYSGELVDKTVFIDDIVLHHKPDNNKSRGQYLPLLELSAKENPMSDQTVFWLGREYFYYKKYDKAIETLKQHLKIPVDIWDEERSASMRFIGKSYQAKGDTKEAQRWFLRAASECFTVREPWVALAQLAYEQKDWVSSLYAAEQGLKILQNSSSYLVEVASWSYLLPDYAAIACYYLKLFEKGYGYAKLACDMQPNDERLQRNFALIQRGLQE